MKYRDGYDGQLVELVRLTLPFEMCPDVEVKTEFIDLTAQGVLVVRAGYSWDYASVPVTHWISNKVGGRKSKFPSLIHDALCQLHRNGHLSHDSDRAMTDYLFYQLLLERKFWKPRAWLWYKAVRLGAKYNKQEPKQIFEAP